MKNKNDHHDNAEIKLKLVIFVAIIVVHAIVTLEYFIMITPP